MATKRRTSTVSRADGWANVLTGLGKIGRDKRTASKVIWPGRMQETEAEETYAGDGLARRIVDLLPAEATREWIEFDEADEDAAVRNEIDRLQVKQKSAQAWNWGRQYGGAAIFLNTGEDSKELAKPLDMTKIVKLQSLVVMNRYELTQEGADVVSDLSDPDFGLPASYRYQSRRGSTTVASYLIHRSRLVRFDGMPLGLRLFVTNGYWGDSIYTGIKEALGDYSTSHASVAHVLQEFRSIIYKLEGLGDALAGGEESKIMTRIMAMHAIRSVLGAHVLDKDEEYEIKSDTFAGVNELLTAMKGRLQSATNIPHTILFNESPSGLGASGQSEQDVWYDAVRAAQHDYLAPKLDRILEVMFAGKQGPTQGKEPEGWDYDFKPLAQESRKETAETEKAEAEGDSIYMDQGVLTSLQVFKRRFPELAEEGGEAELLKAKAMKEAEAQLAAERLRKVVPPPPAPIQDKRRADKKAKGK